jgi:hypothetical protein
MKLEYLLFDFTDDESGSCSFDAMASVLPAHLPGLLAEVGAVLGWAHRGFGAPAAAPDAGEWDFELQALGADDAPLEIAYEIAGGILFSRPPATAGRVTLALAISGSRQFCSALREAFPGSE